MKEKRKKSRPQETSKSALSEHLCVYLVLSGLFVAAIITRIHLLGRSLWLDEAWVANAIAATSLHEAVYYPEWLQTAPPLFIVLARWTTQLLGTSNVALRILPALAGIVSVLLISRIALRLLRPSFAVIAVLLFVFSPAMILYSQSLKQYSTEVLTTLALLALGLEYIDKRSERAFYSMLLVFGALSFLSYVAILFLPFLLYSTCLTVEDSSNTLRFQPDWYRVLLVTMVGVAVAVTNYFVFIAPNNNSNLAEFFSEGFYRGERVDEFIGFYVSRFFTLTRAFFFGHQALLALASLGVTIVGFISLWTLDHMKKGAKQVHIAVLFCAPVMGIVGMNIVELFPLPSVDHRLLLFLFPITDLTFCLGLQFLSNLATRLVSSITSLKSALVEDLLGWLSFGVLLGLLFLFFSFTGLEPFFAQEHEDAEDAVSYLVRQLQADDVLYVHASMREQFKLYTRGKSVEAGQIIYGKIGSPCCPRKDYRPPHRESISDIAADLAALGGAAAGQRLWLLVTARPSAWLHLQRNDIVWFERGLTKLGCGKTNENRFKGVYVGQFVCVAR
jgi:hypothetical protein